MPDRLMFAATFEGLFRAMGPRLDAALAEELARLGVDPRKPLEPAYSLETFRVVVVRLAQVLAPELSEEARIHALGRAFMDAYGHSFVGRAMLAMLSAIGPKRTLARLSRSFRTGNNFSETRVVDDGPKKASLWCNQVTLPGWYEGLISRGLEIAGARNVRVVLIARDDAGGTFSVAWD